MAARQLLQYLKMHIKKSGLTSIAADAAARPAGGVGRTLPGVFYRRCHVAHAARLNVVVSPQRNTAVEISRV